MATQHQAPEELVERVQELLGSLDEIADPVAQPRVQELVARFSSCTELSGALLGVIADAGGARSTSAAHCSSDGIVASLLLIHGLYPVPLEERVAEAVESVSPFPRIPCGDVEILGVEDGVARLRCRAAATAVPRRRRRSARAQGSHRERAPDLLGLEVEAR